MAVILFGEWKKQNSRFVNEVYYKAYLAARCEVVLGA